MFKTLKAAFQKKIEKIIEKAFKQYYILLIGVSSEQKTIWTFSNEKIEMGFPSLEKALTFRYHLINSGETCSDIIQKDFSKIK